MPRGSFDLFLFVQAVLDHGHVEVTESLDLLHGHPLPDELLLHGSDLFRGDVLDHGVEAGLGLVRFHSVMEVPDEAFELGDLVSVFWEESDMGSISWYSLI